MTQKNTEKEHKRFFQRENSIHQKKRITNKESKLDLLDFKMRKLNLDHKKNP